MKLEKILIYALAKGSIFRLLLILILGMFIAGYILKYFSLESVCKREAEKKISEAASLLQLTDQNTKERLVKEETERCIRERQR